MRFLLCKMKALFLRVYQLCFVLFIVTITLQMVHFPIAQNLAYAGDCSDYTAGTVMALQREECGKLPGREWNCTNNHCDYLAEVKEALEEFKACKTDENPQECIKNVVNNKNCLEFYPGDDNKTKREACLKDSNYISNENFTDFDNFTSWESTAETGNLFKTPVVVIHMIFFFISAGLFILKTGFNCPSVSFILMIVGASVSLAGEIGTFFDMKNKLEKLKERFNKTDISFMDIQKNAFDILAEEQGIRSEVEIAKTVVYSIAAASFAGAAALAFKEAWSNQVCVPKVPKADQKSENSATEAAPKELASKFTNVANKIKTKFSEDKVFQSMVHPVPRGILSTTIASMATTLAIYSGLASKKSKERKAEILRIKEKYLSLQPGYDCPSRTDQSRPKCYCNDEFGKKDPEKENSAICKAFWTQSTIAPALEEKADLAALNSLSGPKGCLTLKNEFDPTCKCRKYKDQKGDNSCYKSVLAGPTMNLNNAQWLKNLDATSTSVLSGSSPLNSLNAGENLRMAARIQKIANKNLEDFNSKQPPEAAPFLSVNEASITKAFEEMKKDLSPEMAKDLQEIGVSAPGNSGGIQTSELSGKAQEAMAAIQSKLGLGDSLFYSSGGGSGKRKSPAKNNEFSLGSFGQDSERTAQSHVENVPHNKNFKYGDHDIHKKPSQSLWKIISNRYQKSAYEKLFSDK